MPLHKLEDFEPNYRDSFEGDEIKGLGVYTEGTEEQLGSVSDVLVDEQGHFRYIVVDLGVWIFGKKVLLPIGRSRIDYNAKRVYVVGLSRDQAEQLPEYHEGTTPDYDYEEQVRGIYRTPPVNMPVSPVTDTMGAAIDASYAATTPGSIADAASYPSVNQAATDHIYEPGNPITYNRDTYDYKYDPSLYDLNDRDHQTFKLYEERLVANKNRIKTGEVTVGKRVETETAVASVPIEKERVVIERVRPTDAGTVVTSGEVHFQAGEVARIEVYEETPEIRKEAVVREEVIVRKVVDRDTVDTEETLRREELDVKTEGQPVVRDADELRADLI
jgi:uncharacterized protein (TIGR02271 family)